MDRQRRINRIRRGVAVAGASGLAALWAAVWGLGQSGADDSSASAATPSSVGSTAAVAPQSDDTTTTQGSDDTAPAQSSDDSTATAPLTTRQS